ncbi:MAG TPA: hypothetical protein VFD58_36560 [Blastocatellia bacterium]|nr:hypothetical protein [Blastocatellia bacterium]
MQDFLSRVDYAPEDVYRHRQTGWQYIPVHPFADEPEVLSRLNLKPDDCWSSDAWLAVNNDATLIQSRTVKVCCEQPGLYASQNNDELHWPYLRVIVDAPCITRMILESAMTQFVLLGFPDSRLFQIKPKGGWIRVGNFHPPSGTTPNNP